MRGGTDVEYRRLGKTGWRVSTISMGCWGIGGQWGPVAEDEAIRTIHAALDLGVNLFDTADAYGSGVSEALEKRFPGASANANTRSFIGRSLPFVTVRARSDSRELYAANVASIAI